MKSKRLIVLLITVVLLGTMTAFAGNVVSVKIDNAHAAGNTMELYFTTQAQNIDKQDVSVAFGNTVLKADSVDQISKSGEGVSYIFLIDISGSMKNETVKAQNFLKNAVSNLDSADKAAIVTVADKINSGNFTSDKGELDRQIKAITATDKDTSLYRGITSSIDMFASYQSTINARDVLVVVSDGDEDFNSGITKDEVLSKITAAHIPVFTYVTLPASPSDKQIAASKIFGSFARSSAGGVDYPYTMDEKSAASGVVSSVKNGYAVKLTIDASKLKGEKQYLELTLKTGSVTVKDGYDFRISTDSAGSSASSSSGSESSGSKASSSSSSKQSKTASSSANNGIVSMLLKPQVLIPSAAGLVLVAGLVIVIVVIKSRAKKKCKNGEPVSQSSSESVMSNSQPFTTQGIPQSDIIYSESIPPEQTGEAPLISDIGKTIAVDSAPPQFEEEAKKIKIRLVNISANSRNDTREIALSGSLTIGHDPNRADIAFSEDNSMSGCHCRISFVNDSIFISDLGSTNGTFVNGVPVNGSHKLESDDIILIGSTELRIVFERTNSR